MTRSFFESLDLLHLRGHDGGSGLYIERDICFVNIVGDTGPHGSYADGSRTLPRNPGYDLGTDGPPAAARLADAFAELALVI